jgi:hypothetical protein
MGPSQRQCIQGAASLRVKRPGREATHPPLSRALVSIAFGRNSAPPEFMALSLSNPQEQLHRLKTAFETCRSVLGPSVPENENLGSAEKRNGGGVC